MDGSYRDCPLRGVVWVAFCVCKVCLSEHGSCVVQPPWHSKWSIFPRRHHGVIRTVSVTEPETDIGLESSQVVEMKMGRVIQMCEFKERCKVVHWYFVVHLSYDAGDGSIELLQIACDSSRSSEASSGSYLPRPCKADAAWNSLLDALSRREAVITMPSSEQ